MRKVIVFVSSRDAGPVRKAIALSGAGRLGNYSSSTSEGMYTGVIRTLDEERIEFACDDDTFANIVDAIKVVSPEFASVESWSLETY